MFVNQIERLPTFRVFNDSRKTPNVKDTVNRGKIVVRLIKLLQLETTLFMIV